MSKMIKDQQSASLPVPVFSSAAGAGGSSFRAILDHRGIDTQKLVKKVKTRKGQKSKKNLGKIGAGVTAKIIENAAGYQYER